MQNLKHGVSQYNNSLSNLDWRLLRKVKGKDGVGLSDCEELVRVTHMR